MYLDCYFTVFLLASENDTVRELYLDRHMSDCHLEVYSVCQEGEVLVRKMTVDVDDGEGSTVCKGSNVLK